MLAVLGNWFYILVTTFCLGYAFFAFVRRVFGYQVRSLDGVLTAGFVIAAVYAQIFSLFGGVGLLVNGLLILFCLAVSAIRHRQIFCFFRDSFTAGSPGRKIAVALLFLLWAYFTSRGHMHYDSDLYHAQSIRWIEEYGVVKGLGNLHVRLAYNSSVFAVSALYSMKFLTGCSLHTVNGFLAFLVSTTVLDIAKVWNRKRLLLSDYARVAAVFYLTRICGEVVAPASDYAIMCMIFYIVIKWFSFLENEKTRGETTPFALLSVAGVFAVSLKLTAGLILVLALLPACRFIREKKWKEIVLYLAMGALVIAPWLIRTVLISGWLLYPFPGLDLFSFDWKIPANVAADDAAEIRIWARGLYDAWTAGETPASWFKWWFVRELSFTEKVLIVGDLAGCAVTLGAGAAAVVKKRWDDLPELLALLAVACSYLFWQISAPMVRYGLAYVLLAAVLPAGLLLQKCRFDRAIFFALILFGVYKLYTICVYIGSTAGQPYYVRQQDYGSYELTFCEVDGVKIYLPAEGDRVGYDAFPSAPYVRDIGLRGNTVREGFCPR